MRINFNSKIKMGSLRRKTRFLYFPKYCDGELRWLETASWEEVYHCVGMLEIRKWDYYVGLIKASFCSVSPILFSAVGEDWRMLLILLVSSFEIGHALNETHNKLIHNLLEVLCRQNEDRFSTCRFLEVHEGVVL